MATQTCAICKENKPISDFYKNRKWIFKKCKKCIYKERFEYRRIWRQKKRESDSRWIHRQILHSTLMSTARKRAYFINSFKNKPCTDCKNTFPPICMDFDHIDKNKKYGIANMKYKPLTKEEIITEIQKCELVCANCHRIRTLNRKK